MSSLINTATNVCYISTWYGIGRLFLGKDFDKKWKKFPWYARSAVYAATAIVGTVLWMGAIWLGVAFLRAIYAK